jgi:hypothetical protein
MKKIVISKNDVSKEKVNHLSVYSWYDEGEQHLWELETGEAYKFYSYLSKKFQNSTILDIGTRNGRSAIAFANNPKNKVISFDVVEYATHKELNMPNIELRIGDFMQDKTIDYNNVNIILIDVDPHDGKQEPPMIKYLEDIGWEGILLLDDISLDLWPAINYMWQSLPYEKYDITDIAHFSGTGMINLGKKFKIEITD